MLSSVFDIEANGLLAQATRIWVIVARQLETGRGYIFCDAPLVHQEGFVLAPLSDFEGWFLAQTRVIGHNIIDYDIPLLMKLGLLRHFRRDGVVDTMIFSKMLNYNRFGFGHSLGAWGESLGIAKPEHEDWEQFSPEMLHRCKEDVRLNVAVWEALQKELADHPHRVRLLKGLRAEHRLAEFVARAQLAGFPFNRAKAEALRERLLSALAPIEALLIPKLRPVCHAYDGYQDHNNHKKPRWTQVGDYVATTAAWFGFDPRRGRPDDRPLWGDYCRVTFTVPTELTTEAIKGYITWLGWVPDDWNVKKVGRELVRTTPKLTTSSLLPLGEEGLLIDRYTTTKARLGILEGWLAGLEGDRLHGDCFVIGTPTGRVTHKVIANLPKADVDVFVAEGGSWVKTKKIKKDLTNPLPWLPGAPTPEQEGEVIFVAEKPWGPQFRELFEVLPGYLMVGADSSGNQFRALCHYLGEDAVDYTRQGIEGDIHAIHAAILAEVVPGVNRGIAKPFFYAYIFGAGDEKLSLILVGRRDRELGRRARELFESRIPGFKRLVDRLTDLFNATKRGRYGARIPALDGRYIFLSSLHKALNYLLQSCEKVTCAAATAQVMEALDEKGFDWQPLVFYHDEIQFMVRADQAEEARLIAQEAFSSAPKDFGVMIMAGEAKLGTNWKETH